MSTWGGYITLLNNGLFFKVKGSDAKLCYYLFNIRIKNEIGFLPKEKMNFILLVFDKLSINYLYLNNYHEFIDNQYDYYLMLANKKYEVKKIIDTLGVYHGR